MELDARTFLAIVHSKAAEHRVKDTFWAGESEPGSPAGQARRRRDAGDSSTEEENGDAQPSKGRRRGKAAGRSVSRGRRRDADAD